VTLLRLAQAFTVPLKPQLIVPGLHSLICSFKGIEMLAYAASSLKSMAVSLRYSIHAVPLEKSKKSRLIRHKPGATSNAV
jgi:hypothetical protein